MCRSIKTSCKNIKVRNIYKSLGVDGNNNQPKYLITLHKSHTNVRLLRMLQYLCNIFLTHTSLDYRTGEAHSCHHTSAA